MPTDDAESQKQLTMKGLPMKDNTQGKRHKIRPYENQHRTPIDRNDPGRASTAIEIRFPETFSDKAKKALLYLDDTIFLFVYKGRFVATDESLYLTEHGDGTHEAPTGCPRWEGDNLEKLEKWLEEVADDIDEETDDDSDQTQSPTTDELANAVKIVRAAIEAKEAEYRKIASTEEQEPVQVEGTTKTNFGVQLMVDPKDAAQVFLDYNYATWSILEEDAPDEMWDQFARIYGLDSVDFVGL